MNKIFISRYRTNPVLFLSGDITAKSVNHTIKLLLDNSEVKRINLSTHGGAVDDGLRLVSFLKGNIPDLHIHVEGYAMSMGTVILGAAKKRTMGRDSMLMYHDILGPVDGNYTTSDFEDQVRYHNFRLSLIHQIINPHKEPVVTNFLSNAFKSRRDVYIGASEALRIGLIDEII